MKSGGMMLIVALHGRCISDEDQVGPCLAIESPRTSSVLLNGFCVRDTEDGVGGVGDAAADGVVK